MENLQRPGGELATRPIHFFWMVDCSGSMYGELMAQIFKEQQNDRVYSVELDEMEMEKPKSKGGKKNDLQH